MAKLLMFGLLAGLAGAAYWYFTRSRSSDVYDYADTARDRAADAFESASKMASDAASRVSDQVGRVTDTVRS
ncbi:MAG TPA: hypothetical protein VGL23_17345 [Chloroflexota bacterium]|jgi:hypothetical protein